jgi:hypothetical protein
VKFSESLSLSFISSYKNSLAFDFSSSIPASFAFIFSEHEKLQKIKNLKYSSFAFALLEMHNLKFNIERLSLSLSLSFAHTHVFIISERKREIE